MCDVRSARLPVNPRSGALNVVCPAALMLAAFGCGDDAGTSGAGGGSTSSSSTTTAQTGATTGATSGPGAGGGGGTTTAANSTATASNGAGGSGGQGGGGGPNWEGVDPLLGIGEVDLVETGYAFVEGPLWLASLGVLRWSDIPPAHILQLDGDVITTWRQDSGGSNGLALTPQGTIIACEGAARRLSVSPLDAPNFTLVVDRFEGARFNAPNDAIVRSDGTLFFTDPDYGLPGPDHEIGFNGVYRVDLQGTVHLVDDARVLPNGIALSPDETTLYVADNGSSQLWTYAVAPDGATGDAVLLTATAGGPDGMAVDDAGNLYVTTSAGIDVRRADGTPWGTIAVPEVPANCAFGGPDRNELFITARTSLYRVQLVIPGPP